MTNTLKTFLDSVLSHLHTVHLKPLGFRKRGRTFSRDRGSYWERFHFQGSAINSPSTPKWRFYINIGVEFKDLEPRRGWSYFPHTHWADRIRQVVPRAPDQWEYDLVTDRPVLEAELAERIVEASRQMERDISIIRQRYLEEEEKRRAPDRGELSKQ